MLARRLLRFFSADPVSAVLSQPVIPKVPLAKTHPRYEEDLEATGKYKVNPDALPGNVSQLKLGKAQSLRVNNPQTYTTNDVVGRAPTHNPKFGSYQDNEVGGHVIPDGGLMQATQYNHACVSYSQMDNQKRIKAIIHYKAPSAMHRVPVWMKDANSQGKWVISFEKKYTTKNPFDGENLSLDPASWVQSHFYTCEDAVRFCQVYGWAYEVEPVHTRKVVKKSYADNFKFIPPKN